MYVSASVWFEEGRRLHRIVSLHELLSARGPTSTSPELGPRSCKRVILGLRLPAPMLSRPGPLPLRLRGSLRSLLDSSGKPRHDLTPRA